MLKFSDQGKIAKHCSIIAAKPYQIYHIALQSPRHLVHIYNFRQSQARVINFRRCIITRARAITSALLDVMFWQTTNVQNYNVSSLKSKSIVQISGQHIYAPIYSYLVTKANLPIIAQPLLHILTTAATSSSKSQDFVENFITFQ